MSKSHVISLILFFSLVFALDSVAQITPPEEGKAKIVFYRKKKMSGGAIKFSLQDSERVYGDLKNGDVLEITVDPGEHTFYSKVLSEDAITLEVEEGKTYYVKTTIRVGYVVGRPKFEQVDEKTARKEIK